MDTKKIILADDHSLFRLGFEELISGCADYELIKTYSNGKELWNDVESINCDLLVLDINLPEKSGLEILEKFRNINPKVNILVLSQFPEEIFAVKSFKLGAKGYLCKEEDYKVILEAISTILNGDYYISKNFAKKLAFEFLKIREETTFLSFLKEMDLEIIKCLVHGKSNIEIAKKLGISAKTVSNRKNSILKNLNFKNVSELILWADKNNIK